MAARLAGLALKEAACAEREGTPDFGMVGQGFGSAVLAAVFPGVVVFLGGWAVVPSRRFWVAPIPGALAGAGLYRAIAGGED